MSVLPTLNFFYGMKREEELSVDLASGKTLIVRLMAKGKADEEGKREVFFELNGQSDCFGLLLSAISSWNKE